MIRISYRAFDVSIKNINRTNVGSLCVLQRKILQQDEKQIHNRLDVRFNSSFASGVDSSSFVQELVQTGLTAEPSLSSLGLGGLSPKGFIQSSLELLHTGFDVPWWTAIVIGTVCIRIAIFPLVIIAQRNAANMGNHMPTIQRLQQQMTKARMEGDSKAVMEHANRMTEFMKENKINPLKNMFPVLAQVPIFLSVFAGIREMASLPVESMKMGGMLWFTDLTIPDPMYLLPVMTAATLLATVEVGVDGIKAEQIGSSAVKMILRSFPFISIPIMINFPTAMLCYWFTSNTFSLLQVLFLRLPRVRNYFSIPEIINHGNAYPVKELDVPKMSFMDSFRLGVKNLEIAKEMQERERLEALKMKESSQTMEQNNKPMNPPKDQ